MLKFKSVNIATAVIFIGLCFVYLFEDISFWWFLSIFIIWFIITALGSSFIGWNYHITSLNSSSKTQKNHIAITFDDGPHPEFTPQVLDVLKKYHAKATFFCIGKHIEAHPSIFERIINEGHVVGNHTFSHDNRFGFFNTKKVISELEQTNATVKKLTGLTMQLYRPAFGVTNPRINKALQLLQLQSVGWNKRSLDTTVLNKDKVLNRVTKNLKKGDVILLHDTSSKSVLVLEQLLIFLRHENLQSVTISDLFNVEAYA